MKFRDRKKMFTDFEKPLFSYEAKEREVSKKEITKKVKIKKTSIETFIEKERLEFEMFLKLKKLNYGSK
jgi:hypothetical protein